MKGDVVRIREAGKIIGISKTTIERLWHAGVLEGEASATGCHEVWLDLDLVLAYKEEHGRLARSRQALREGRLGDVEYEDSDLLTTWEACALAGITRTTLYAWTKLGLVEGLTRTPGGNGRIEFRDIGKLSKQKGKPRA